MSKIQFFVSQNQHIALQSTENANGFFTKFATATSWLFFGQSSYTGTPKIEMKDPEADTMSLSGKSSYDMDSSDFSE